MSGREWIGPDGKFFIFSEARPKEEEDRYVSVLYDYHQKIKFTLSYFIIFYKKKFFYYKN